MAHKAYDHIEATMEVVVNTFPEVLDFARFVRQTNLMPLPDWCYFPHDVIRFFLAQNTTVPNQGFETVRLGVALSWWQYKAVYRIKRPVLQALVSRPEPKGVLGDFFLAGLPEWGGYVDMVAAKHEQLEGFWWHFDAVADYNQEPIVAPQPRLMVFMMIRGEGLSVIYLTLGTSLREAVRGWIQDGLARADRLAVTIPLEMGAVDGVVRMLTPVVNILLYFLGEQTCFVPVGPPATKLPAGQVQVIDVS